MEGWAYTVRKYCAVVDEGFEHLQTLGVPGGPELIPMNIKGQLFLRDCIGYPKYKTVKGYLSL